MNDQGAPRHPRPDDAWWHTVYEGPAGTLPDTPAAVADTSTVDDWFTTAAGLIAPQRRPADPPATALPPEAEVVADPEPATAVPPPPRSWAQAAWPERGPAPEVRPPAPDLVKPDLVRPAPSAGPVPAARPAAPTPTVPDLPLVPPPPPAALSHDQAAPEPVPEPVPVREPEPEPAREPVAELAPAPAAEPLAAPLPVQAAAPPAAAPAQPVPAQPVPAQPAQPERAAPWRGRPEAAAVPHVGERPPTYEAEPTALPAADPESLAALVPDTALEGAQFGATTLRAVSIRGDSARYRGEPRRDALLTVRFGEGEDGLVLAVLAAPARRANAQWGSAAAADAARQLASAIGRSREALSADLRAGARDRLRYGLQRIALQAAVRLRSAAETAGEAEGDATEGAALEQAEAPLEELASLHCLLVSTDPAATHRAAFGTGPGGLYLLRSGHWIDAYAARLLHHPDGQPPLPPAARPAARPFRFRLVPATAGDILLLCTPGLAEPIAEEPAVAHFLSSHWAHPHPPGSVDFLRQIQVRAKGYADDRTAAAIWTE
ncbi:protein phosphatase 2C domain-containing protein [Kitasatospora sp. NPDC049285]|uniref:protein phosphatase 2C domain-containing protein n=1 Tax=Kitasatospora sp. NPDC049285 TaxID=3157096 RepID=UPI003424856D